MSIVSSNETSQLLLPAGKGLHRAIYVTTVSPDMKHSFQKHTQSNTSCTSIHFNKPVTLKYINMIQSTVSESTITVLYNTWQNTKHYQKSGLEGSRLWTRYVDDTFIIWPHGPPQLQRFHEHLNQQCPNIQFTMETEDDGKIPS